MAQAGSVVIELEAGTAQFSQNMDAAGKKLNQFGKEAEGAGGKSAEFGEAIKGLAEKFALLEIAKKAVEELKATFEEMIGIEKGALKLGIDVEDFSRLQHAANATHTDISALETGIDHLSREIGKVASGDTGAKGAADALKKLGLNASELSALSPDETFRKVAEALGTLHTQYERAAAQQELFGKGGRELTDVMEHLAELEKESDQIGFTRTADQMERAEQAERNIAKVTDTVKGLLMDIAGSSIMGAISDKVASIYQHWVGFAVEIQSAIKNEESLGKEFDKHAKVIEELHEQYKQTGAGSDEALSIARGMVAENNKLLEIAKQRNAAALTANDMDEALRAHSDVKELEQQAQHYKSILDYNEQLHASKEKQVKADADGLKILKEMELSVKGLADGGDHWQKALEKLKASGANKEEISQGELLAAEGRANEEKEKGAKEASTALDALRQKFAALSGDKDQSKQNLIGQFGTNMQKAEARRLAEMIESAEKDKKLLEEKKHLLEELATPADKYKERLIEINKLEEAGLLTKEKAGELAEDAAAKLVKSQEKGEDRSADAVIRQFSFDLPNSNNNDVVDPMKKAAEILARQDQREQQQVNKWEAIFPLLRTFLTPGGQSTVSIPNN